MDTMKLEIVTPHGPIFSGDVKSATFPGIEGEFGVLPSHASLVTLLDAGVIEIEKKDGKVESIVIDSGYVKVDEQKTLVVVEGAVAIQGDTESEIAKSIAEAKELVKKATTSDFAIANVEAKVEAAAKTRF
ncbi:ATP synthase F1 subunit epsilon [Hydrogenimonas thermophila]|uniref:ATP synthase epsilon chain n=1 Tax=Hydrogenimonas thermophila TaxID=223786 RepID=A0A1I5SIQ9_9BACT|nr:ATP synthase F1 subunit epsilon [Hydrogenimonas thermophila]WOE70876.1 ATP synthase F1 subunit epsilon [Hydrogenimonas thermophila]WOE73394.1 ATP synthase F1 subunit epsilon [Hydrogenimonas thermophila]SFP70612.1 ATP synthase F1 subcomplex epsilon subunit [Hydrogenimonas thermophila]